MNKAVLSMIPTPRHTGSTISCGICSRRRSGWTFTRTTVTGSTSGGRTIICGPWMNSIAKRRSYSGMNKPILVTGASGFIGSHLTRALESAGHSVYRHSAKDGNIASCALVYKGVQHVYHLAAKTFVPESWTSPLGFYETNVLGTINVLEFCRREGASATMLSSYVYGKPDRLPIDEDHPVRPLNPTVIRRFCASKRHSIT